MCEQRDIDPYLAVRKASAAPWPGPRGPRVELSAGDLSATIYPMDGCRLTSLTIKDSELLRQWNPERRAFQYGVFPMIPWVGRLGNGLLRFRGDDYHLPINKPPHALHGLACFGPWETLETTGDSATFSFKLTEPWPWAGVAIQRFDLTRDGLTITLTVQTEEQEFPAAAGWHPWFSKWTGTTDEVARAEVGNKADELQIGFTADWQEEPGSDELPTGRRIPPREGPWDDAFGFGRAMTATLVWPHVATLEMTSPAHSMVVFTTQPDAACVEPLSGPPNGVNTAPDVVTLQHPLTITTTWRVSAV